MHVNHAYVCVSDKCTIRDTDNDNLIMELLNLVWKKVHVIFSVTARKMLTTRQTKNLENVLQIIIKYKYL